MAKQSELPPARTPNQVVAYNLRAARSLRGWTQEEAAVELERYLGVRWSKATFSAAERSSVGDRTREFTADEIIAFAQAFSVPVAWFFLPMARTGYAVSALPGATVADSTSLDPLGVLALVFPPDQEQLASELSERIDGLGLDEAGRAAAWRVVHDHLVALTIAVANRTTGGVADRRGRLRRAMAIADAVGGLFDAEGAGA